MNLANNAVRTRSRTTRSRSASAPTARGPDLGPGHRDRDPAGGSGAHLRSLHPRHGGTSSIPRQRPRPGHRQGDRRSARRTRRARQPDRPRGPHSRIVLPRSAGRAMSRILIAEDDPLIGSFLEKGSCAPASRRWSRDDGEQAEQLRVTGDFDLMILDMGLPLRDGLHVLRSFAAGASISRSSC